MSLEKPMRYCVKHQQISPEVEAPLIDAYPDVTNIMGGTVIDDYGPMNAKDNFEKYALFREI